MMGKVHCVVHTSKVHVGYCQDCEKYVCIECMMVQHKGHLCIQLDKIAEIKTKELSKFIAKFKEINLMSLEENANVLKEERQQYKEQVAILISDIKERAEVLKLEIDNLRDELIRELTQMEKEDLKQFQQSENKMNKEIAELKKLIQSTEEEKNIPTGTDAIQYVAECQQKLLTFQASIKLPSNIAIPCFFTTETIMKELKKSFGYLGKEDIKHGRINAEKRKSAHARRVDILSTFSTGQCPSRMAAMSDEESWVSDSNLNGDLTLVRRDGKVIKTFSTKLIINDLAVTKSGDLFLTDGYNSKIVCMKKRGEFVDYFSTAPDTPWGLCVTDTGDILVTLCQNVGSVGKVICLSPNKKIKQTIKHNEDRDLFTLPHFITQNKNKDLWIQDKGYHHVIAVDQSGKPRFTYKGPTGVKMGSAFDPHNLSSTLNGDVIIADYTNATLHLVDKDGQFLRYIMTSQEGLSGPYALTKSINGVLWIGDNKHKEVFVVKCLE